VVEVNSKHKESFKGKIMVVQKLGSPRREVSGGLSSTKNFNRGIL
jgi:hypothetical protein